MSLQSEVEKLPPEERRKIGELIRTKGDQHLQLKNANGPDASTAWMYEQPKGNAEDFLLGKAIRSLEELTEINRDQEEETPTQRLTRLDMEAKFREDPLNLMRQHEMDKRSALLQNTARMKKLQRLIELQNHAKEKAEKRKEKRKKESKRKNKRRRISSSSSNDSSENPEDDAILEKFISLIRNPDGAKDKAEDSEKREERKKKEEKRRNIIIHRRKSNCSLIKNPHLQDIYHHSDDRPLCGSKSMSGTKALKDRGDWNRREPRPKSPQSPRSNQHSQKASHVGSLYCTDQRKSRSRSQQKAHECRTDDRTRRRSRSRSFVGAVRQHRSLRSHSHLQGRHKRSSRSGSFEQSHRRGARRRTQEEMAVLRAQMAADAKERAAERRQRFEKHRSETAREEKVEGEARAKHGASFLRGLTLDHVASTSVEEGVQRNAKSRQRGGMNENFLRR
ncbi:pre mRNA splicing factor CWC25 [Echinococcus multilocularis]|uniref:Pre mRNA splicing factor CWC25 n=1 Tax=Echinococcus multilocularis TaxID=6211 RepID=A0A068Y5B2_ECHMU|nr:pre mRNA splicing factor CWC25 [Echinococcus multilocularis]